ncbi:hypothetical protein TNCV_4103621 [Trichonephila clavipes]|nr:hypothetical protein TNCV_4103621 [Trichonephila clavipes]
MVMRVSSLGDGNANPYCNSWLRAPTPSTSPGLTPSDFHLFLTLKRNLAVRHFRSNAEVKQAVKFRKRGLSFEYETIRGKFLLSFLAELPLDIVRQLSLMKVKDVSYFLPCR